MQLLRLAPGKPALLTSFRRMYVKAPPHAQTGGVIMRRSVEESDY